MSCGGNIRDQLYCQNKHDLLKHINGCLKKNKTIGGAQARDYIRMWYLQCQSNCIAYTISTSGSVKSDKYHTNANFTHRRVLKCLTDKYRNENEEVILPFYNIILD